LKNWGDEREGEKGGPLSQKSSKSKIDGVKTPQSTAQEIVNDGPSAERNTASKPIQKNRNCKRGKATQKRKNRRKQDMDKKKGGN